MACGIFISSVKFSGQTCQVTFLDDSDNLTYQLGDETIPFTYFPPDNSPQGTYFIYFSGTDTTYPLVVSGACPTPTPTITPTPTVTPTQGQYNGLFSTGSTSGAACISSSIITLYSNQPFYTPNQLVYTNPGLTILAPLGYYVNNGVVFDLGFFGFVSQGSCPTQTPTPTVTPSPTPFCGSFVMIGGSFGSINDVTREFIGRTNTNGTTDLTWPNASTEFDSSVTAPIVPQSNGKQIVGGAFTTYNGTNVGRICRLNIDGSLDTTFNTGGTGFNNTVNAIWVNTDNTILVGGEFTTYNGVSANKIIKLNSDGTINDTFDYGSGFNDSINWIEKNGSGYYIGGKFTTFKGSSYLRFIVINDLGNILGPNLGNGTNGEVFNIQVDGSGNYAYIGGDFNTWNGLSIAFDIVKVSTSTWTFDSTFNTNVNGGSNGNVRALIYDNPTSRLYIGGTFTTFSGNSSLSRLLALNDNGTSYTTFNTNKITPSNFVRRMSNSNITPDSFYIMGAFQDYDSDFAKNRIALISKVNGDVSSFTVNVFGGIGQEPFWAYDFNIPCITSTNTPTPTNTETPTPTVTPTKTIAATPTPTQTPIPFVPGSFTFDADYIVLTYSFTDGQDLDTRTKVTVPDIGQATLSDSIGWCCSEQWPTTGNPILTWGGDNTGTGFESVLIDLIEFKSQYPGENTIIMNSKAFWYGELGSNPVTIQATLYKGGTMILDSDNYTFYNNTFTAAYGAVSPGTTVTINESSCIEGENITSLQYNIITFSGQFI
jgi:hypothetical protein